MIPCIGCGKLIEVIGDRPPAEGPWCMTCYLAGEHVEARGQGTGDRGQEEERDVR